MGKIKKIFSGLLICLCLLSLFTMNALAEEINSNGQRNVCIQGQVSDGFKEKKYKINVSVKDENTKETNTYILSSDNNYEEKIELNDGMYNIVGEVNVLNTNGSFSKIKDKEDYHQIVFGKEIIIQGEGQIVSIEIDEDLTGKVNEKLDLASQDLNTNHTNTILKIVCGSLIIGLFVFIIRNSKGAK